jgi:hypothetical protein
MAMVVGDWGGELTFRTKRRMARMKINERNF